MPPHKKHVLCVEDDEETCLLICNLLGLIDCEVTTVQSVGEALEKIKGGNFDLYLLDNWLPGGSGIELCRKIRETDSQTPVIFYTGASYDSDRQEAIRAGAQVYLVKPSDISFLVPRIRELLHLP